MLISPNFRIFGAPFTIEFAAKIKQSFANRKTFSSKNSENDENFTDTPQITLQLLDTIKEQAEEIGRLKSQIETLQSQHPAHPCHTPHIANAG